MHGLGSYRRYIRYVGIAQEPNRVLVFCVVARLTRFLRKTGEGTFGVTVWEGLCIKCV